MKRRTVKKEISELVQRLSPIASKYLAASTRVHQDVIFDYQRMIEFHVVDLMGIYLSLDSSWPHKERWLDGLSEEFSWERKRAMIYGTGELFWGHRPEVSREITGSRFTTVLKPCPRHGTEYVFKYWDNQTVRIYSSRHWCRNQQRVTRAWSGLANE